MMRTVVVAVVVVALALAVAAGRAVWEGGRALDDGDAAARRGDTAEAIASWRRAARWYVPVVGATGDALDRLERTATEAEGRGDPATALAAWQAERTALVAIRGAIEPFADRRARAEARLAALLAAPPAPAAGDTADQRAAWHRQALAGAGGVERAWLVVAAVGLALWLAGSVALARKGGTRGVALVGAGAALWLAGLLLA